MKKVLIYAACATLLFSSCDSYTGSGAYAGVSLGSILGSAIGGIADGPRGLTSELSLEWQAEPL